MQKLIQGILDFRRRVRPEIKDTFARLALGQAPDALFIACSDSRVAANVFASTNPGDLFVVRNVGNMIPACTGDDASADSCAAAAVEFALANLQVDDIIVCGHSDCGAMQAILKGGDAPDSPNLAGWLRHGRQALGRIDARLAIAPNLARHNALSQENVLLQLEHLASYPIVRERLAQGSLQLHGWWFDIAQAEVSTYDAFHKRFVVIDECNAPRFACRDCGAEGGWARLHNLGYDYCK